MATVGIIFFWLILGMAFWGIIFVMAVALPYMLHMFSFEKFAPALADKLTGYTPEECEEIRAGKWSSRR